MKILAIILILFPLTANAALLTWSSVPTADGYTVYFTDGTTQYIHTVGDNTTCDTAELNLVPNVAYTFTVRAYNQYGEGPDSNSVTYTQTGYSPPADILPVGGQAPSEPSELNI